MIAPAIVAAWQRYCLEHPTGELTISAANALHLLKVYATFQAAPELFVDTDQHDLKYVRVPIDWELGESVRLVRTRPPHI
jgi:hypothetical protein